MTNNSSLNQKSLATTGEFNMFGNSRTNSSKMYHKMHYIALYFSKIYMKLY